MSAGATDVSSQTQVDVCVSGITQQNGVPANFGSSYRVIVKFSHLRDDCVTSVSEILPLITLDGLVSVTSVMHLTLGVRAIFFLRYRLVE